ncbi:MAG: hypothetical protein ACREJ4_01185 [Candidatus Methylomirabilaceae bacterium]
MVRLLTPKLREWAQDAGIVGVLLQASGEKRRHPRAAVVPSLALAKTRSEDAPLRPPVWPTYADVAGRRRRWHQAAASLRATRARDGPVASPRQR